MEGLRRMFCFRDSVRGVKLPVMIVIVLAQIYLPIILLGDSSKGRPQLFTFFVICMVVWVVAATILNRLRHDPYYSFEFVPTYLIVVLSFLVILFLVAENQPEVFGGSDPFTSTGISWGSSLLSFPTLVTAAFISYFIGAIGSSIALLFSGSSTGIGTWAKGVADDFKGLTESDRESRGSASAPATPSAMPSSSAPSAASLDEGQIAARNAWQATTGGNHIYCRKCGEKSAIWDPADFCNRCGQIRGISTPEVECIEKCGARIGKEDKFCFRCGAQQPV